MQSDQIPWDDYTARQTAPETGEELAGQPKPFAKNKRQEPSLSALLMQSIQVAGARRGHLSQAERIREQVLLEVLTAAIRRSR